MVRNVVLTCPVADWSSSGRRLGNLPRRAGHFPGHRACREKPGARAEGQFADGQDPSKPVSGVLESARDVHHRHKTKHRDAEQQAGPAHQNFCGNAQRRGQQRKAEEIGPKQRPRHVRGHHGHEGFCGREMQGAEDRQGCGETQIAQGYDFVEAAGLRDIVPGSPQRNEENQDAGAAHRKHRARDFKECGENG